MPTRLTLDLDSWEATELNLYRANYKAMESHSFICMSLLLRVIFLYVFGKDTLYYASSLQLGDKVLCASQSAALSQYLQIE